MQGVDESYGISRTTGISVAVRAVKFSPRSLAENARHIWDFRVLASACLLSLSLDAKIYDQKIKVALALKSVLVLQR